MPKEDESSPRGYPLIALFGLVTICAILTALVMLPFRSGAITWDGHFLPTYSWVRRPPSTANIIIVAVITGLAMLFTSVVIGMHSHRRLVGALIGLVVGLVIGAVVGALALLPMVAMPGVAGFSVGSAVAIVLVSSVHYLVNRRGGSSVNGGK